MLRWVLGFELQVVSKKGRALSVKTTSHSKLYFVTALLIVLAIATFSFKDVRHRIGVSRLTPYFGIVEEPNRIILAPKSRSIEAIGRKELHWLRKDVYLNLSGLNIHDSDLVDIYSMRNLKILNLDYTLVTGDGISGLGKQNYVSELFLNDCAIDDDGVKELEGLNLKILEISGNEIGDDSIPALLTLSNLSDLSLHGCRFSEKGIATIESNLPKCQVISGSQRPVH